MKFTSFITILPFLLKPRELLLFSTILNHYKESFSGLSKNAWVLTFSMFINRSGSMVLFFLMLYLTDKLEYSIETAGIIFSFYGLGAMVGAFLGGWLSDKTSTKMVQIISLFLGGLGYIGFAFVEGTILLTTILFLLAIIVESYRPAAMTAIAISTKPENRARGIALIRAAINLGVSIGPAIGGFLALYDYKYIFWVEGVTSILAAIFLYFKYHEPEREQSTSTSKIDTAIKSPWKDPLYLKLLGLILFSGFVFNQFFNTWPIFLKEIYLFPEDTIGFIIALNAILIVLFEMPLIHRVNNLNHLKIMGWGFLIMCVGFGSVMFHNTISFVSFTVIIWSFGEMLAFPFMTTFIANRANASNRGSYMGMLTFVFSLSFAIGPIMGTTIYNSLGPNYLWWMIILFGFILLGGFYRISSIVEKEEKPGDII